MLNLYFKITYIVFVFATFLIFSELRTLAKIAGDAYKDEKSGNSQLKKKKPAVDRDARVKYIFGFSGFTSFTSPISSFNKGSKWIIPAVIS